MDAIQRSLGVSTSNMKHFQDFSKGFPLCTLDQKIETQKLALSGSQLKDAVSSAITSGRKASLKSWEKAEMKVDLTYDGKQGVCATVSRGKVDSIISGPWIRGIPDELRHDPVELRSFLQDTYIKVSQFSDTSYGLEVCPRLKGGVGLDDERLDAETLTKLRQAIDHAQNARGKEVIALIGDTGTGKSTAINYLLGKRMAATERGMSTVINVAAGEQEAAKIGHQLQRSETDFTHIYPVPNSRNALADCGGFLDTRGVSTEIAVNMSLKLTMQNARNVKLVLCLACDKLIGDRCVAFMRTLSTVLGTLLRDYRAHQGSIILMITKPSRLQSGRLVSAQDVKGLFEEIKNECAPGSERRAWMEFLLRNNGRYICVCDPMSPEGRNTILQLFNTAQAIEEPSKAFKTAYSENAKLRLFEEMSIISTIGSDCYRKFFSIVKRLNNNDSEIASLNQKITKITKDIGQLMHDFGSKEDNLDSLKATEANIKKERERAIEQERDKITDLKNEIKKLNLKSQGLKDQLIKLAQEGEQESCYWTDEINKDGVSIKHRQTVTVTHTVQKSGGFFGKVIGGIVGTFVGGPIGTAAGTAVGGMIDGDDSTTEISKPQTVISDIPLPIERHFSYQGPPILRVVKFPNSPKYWKDERLNETSYSVDYATDPGEKASASVSVYTQKKHQPEEIAKKFGLEQEITNTVVEVTNCANQQGLSENSILREQNAINVKGNLMERIEGYKNTQAEYEHAKQGIEAEKLVTVQEKDELRNRIQQRSPDFVFLKDYLELSQDEELKSNEIVKKFLELDEKFHTSNI